MDSALPGQDFSIRKDKLDIHTYAFIRGRWCAFPFFFGSSRTISQLWYSAFVAASHTWTNFRQVRCLSFSVEAGAHNYVCNPLKRGIVKVYAFYS
jgi:hypothetical protein